MIKKEWMKNFDKKIQNFKIDLFSVEELIGFIPADASVSVQPSLVSSHKLRDTSLGSSCTASV